jgi:aminopeptidase N
MKLFTAILILSATTASAQTFTRKDSLQGGFSFERTCYDVRRYGLDITINPTQRSIVGFNDISFRMLRPSQLIQLDLFENMNVDSIVYDKKKLLFIRESNAVFVDFTKELPAGSDHRLQFYYSGRPTAAKNAPWDGGFVWKKDSDGKMWIGVAVQGTGASLWYPCKDGQSDEPDLGASIKVAVPNGLMNVSNGRFTGQQDLGNGYTRWDWEVKNPINNYDITVNIADYVHIHDTLDGLDLDYYVLRKNEAVAKAHFSDVKPMLGCFQSKFGKYPFADDGYKLVETPYLGMEHQSAIAYGNKYMKGYMGNDISGTGIGLLFDYIVVHESGHEWFGNSITSRDIADMWIHEGFTMYSESVFIECLHGYDKALAFINGEKRNIMNDKPVIGNYGVNDEGSGDMYYKGALMLNTIRHIIADDEKWWKLLRDFSEAFKYQIITSNQVLQFFNMETGLDLTPVFLQYLKSTNIPALELTVQNGKATFAWTNCNPGFNMPVDVMFGPEKVRLKPTAKKQTAAVPVVKPEEIKVLTDHFLINVK